MMQPRVRALANVRRLLSQTRLPGRYLLAEAAGKLLMPVGGTVDGRVGKYQVTFDLRDLIQRQAFFGLYDENEVRLLSRALGAGDVFLDAGANTGYYSLIASQIVGPAGRVHAFEPIADNVAVLRRAVAANQISNIRINQAAVGAGPGTLDLFVSDGDIGNSGWASVVPSEHRPRRVTVETLALDDYCRREGIGPVRLVKLDIEGGEPEALRGMHGLLSSEHAPDLLCEVNPYLLTRRGLAAGDVTGPLAGHGYRLFRVAPKGLMPVMPGAPFRRPENLYCAKQGPAWA